MGAWGAGVFSDDLGLTVRDRYRDCLGEGLSGPEATDALLELFREVLEDPDSLPVFWLALAVAQWKVGRLEDRVREGALAAIADSSAVRAWEYDANLLRARQRELGRVEGMLRSAQPAEKKVRKKVRLSCDWEAGELISYRLRSGNLVLFRVVGLWTDDGGTAGVVEVLDWCGPEIAGVEVLSKLGIREIFHPPPHLLPQMAKTSQFLVFELSKKRIPSDRLVRLGISLPPTQEVGGFMGWPWRIVDEELEKHWGLV